MCVLLGDRYEVFSAAIACILNDVKIVHIHGANYLRDQKMISSDTRLPKCQIYILYQRANIKKEFCN